MTYRIAIIQRFLPSRSRGGVGHFTHGLANALIKRGHHVTVFSQDPAPEDALYEVTEVQGLKNKWAPLLFPFKLRGINFSLFDIIHAQGDDQWLKKTPSQPLIRTMHGSSFVEAFYNGLMSGSLKHALLHLVFYWNEWLASTHADKVIGVSQHTLKFYPQTHGVIYNGIECSDFQRNAKTKTSHPTILFVGELMTRKRGHALLSAFRRIIRPAFQNAELWMVCPEKIEEPGVVWFHSISQKKLIELYQQAWVFCLPSSYEGFGRPYAEALAAGTPVVATRNPGACEVLDNGGFGVITELTHLGHSLLQLLSDYQKRLYYSEHGKLRAQAFDWSKIAYQYEQVYDSCFREKS